VRPDPLHMPTPAPHVVRRGPIDNP
jgi:hypothetical protein